MSDPKRFVASLINEIPPSGIRKFFDLIATTEGVISLGVGEPDFATPDHIIEATVKSLRAGTTAYTSNQGLPELRDEIAAYLKRWLNLDYDGATEVMITTGVSEGVDLAFRAFLEPGDEVLMPEPTYVSYAPGVRLAGGVPVSIQTYAENDFRLTAEQLEPKITPRSKFLILPYPNNPTGGTMGREDYAALVDLIEKHDLLILSDEIYGELTYDGEHASIAQLPGMWERTVVLNGFSKAYAMTGWRVGFACGPKELVGAMNKIHQYSALCSPTMGQVAAVEALRNGDADKRHMIESYNRRRHQILNGLKRIGMACFEPKGAFYVFPSIAITGLSSDEFSERLLFEEKVAVVPGTAFGSSGEGFIRCCYAASPENIDEALCRIERFVQRIVSDK
ncbi:MAG: pyridoxal phosphate-dependent aminotransferase [Solirubrobacterales bacterium]